LRFINKINIRVKILIIFLVSSSPFGLLSTEYYFMSPGPPYQWDVEVLGQESFDFDGSLYQLTVRRDEANYYTYLWAKMDSSVDLYEKERILPKGVTPEELDEISRVNMRNSENIAIAVALQSMGYEVTSSGDGVLVVGLLDDSPVKDKLEKGDLITAINGNIVSSVSDFIGKLRTYEIGDTVSITYIRKGKTEVFDAKLIQHVQYEGEPMVGFLASTPNEQYDFPFTIDIKTGIVGGPSAGLMMALLVYNMLTPEDITKGNVIAGTGTIAIDGSVGPVGGVKQKVIAAKRAGASLILVPTSNLQEVSEYNTNNVEIIAISSFSNAIAVISEFTSR
jgi:PDZ domain-containing protein